MRKEEWGRERQQMIDRQEMEQWVDSKLSTVSELRSEVNRLHHGMYDWSIEQKKGL